ncbi:MAG: hypothetical protein JO202_12375 [Ktedonobacteraceae bacterium]|nr:hypothetical protein [Ktedonobacteraceae bacterium]
MEKGLEYLHTAVITAPEQDIATRGNAVQLLARGYLKAGQLKQFERFMAQAEELAGQLMGEGIMQGQYGLKSVYEEYAKSYALRGDMQKALEYIWKAQRVPAYDKHWEIVLKTTTAMALVRGGEVHDGVDLAVECVELCRQFGTIRLLERIYSVQSHLERLRRNIGQSSGTLREALDGPSEY